MRVPLLKQPIGEEGWREDVKIKFRRVVEFSNLGNLGWHANMGKTLSGPRKKVLTPNSRRHIRPTSQVRGADCGKS